MRWAPVGRAMRWATSARPRTPWRGRPRCWTRSAGSPRTSTPPPSAWSTCGRDREGPRRGAVAGLVGRRRHPAAADRAPRRRWPPPTGCGRPTARPRIRWRPSGGWRRPTSRWSRRCRWPAALSPGPARGRRPRPGRAHPLDHRGGNRLHRHPPGCRRTGTRLAEAQRHLDVAVDQGRDDPVGALREARRPRPWRRPPSTFAQADVSVVRRRLRRRLRWSSRRLSGGYGGGRAASTWAAWCSAGILLGGRGGGSAVAAASRRRTRERRRPVRRGQLRRRA